MKQAKDYRFAPEDFNQLINGKRIELDAYGLLRHLVDQYMIDRKPIEINTGAWSATFNTIEPEVWRCLVTLDYHGLIQSKSGVIKIPYCDVKFENWLKSSS